MGRGLFDRAIAAHRQGQLGQFTNQPQRGGGDQWQNLAQICLVFGNGGTLGPAFGQQVVVGGATGRANDVEAEINMDAIRRDSPRLVIDAGGGPAIGVYSKGSVVTSAPTFSNSAGGAGGAGGTEPGASTTPNGQPGGAGGVHNVVTVP